MDCIFYSGTLWIVFHAKKSRGFIMANKRKKGEVTTQQIVLLIILIVSFIVILFLLFRLNLGKTTEEEACHNSVVTRGAGVLPKDAIPLNCKTKYICISKDGTCEEMDNSEIIKAQTKTEVYSVLAEKMSDCWWMFGEGKLNYVGNTFKSNLYCSLCSQIAFDNSLDIFQGRTIGKKDFYTYLSKTNISGKDISYLDYLVGIKNADDIENNLKTNNADFGVINLDKQQYIMMGIYSQVGIAGWVIAGAGAGGVIAVALVLSPLTGGASLITASGIIMVNSGIIGGGVGSYFLGTYIKGESGQEYMTPSIVEASQSEYEKLQCASIKTLA